jgi:RND family efflux transporter MFP subunit
VAADQPVAVRVSTVHRVTGPAEVLVSGQVEANVTAMLAFQVSGRVSRVMVDEGQPVRQGQALATLESADYRNAYEAAAGQAAAASATERKAQNGPRPQELEEARIDADRWADEYKRMKYLYDHQSLAANDFKKVEAGYEAAQQRYQMAREGTRPEEKQGSTGQSKAAAAQRAEAAKRLADCTLRAPIAGVVSLRKIDPGVTVDAGSQVLAVLDLDPVKVRVAVPESEIGKVHSGERAVVTIPSLGGRAFEGKVDAVSAASDPASRTYTVKIAVANRDKALKAGMVAEAKIFSDVQRNMLTVAAEAVNRDERGATQVWIYEAGRKRTYARRVDVGSAVGGEVEIRTGLTGGEQIVVAGGQKLHEGAPAYLAGGAQ